MREPVESAPPRHDCTGYVLAGGQSSRMGRDKALVEVAGEPLIAHALRTLRPLCADVRILSGPPNFDRDAVLSSYAVLVPDEHAAHSGPLAGLAAALADCRTPFALLLAVDQPAVSDAALARLAAEANRPGTLAACLRNGEAAEPLPLLAATALLPLVHTALASGERRFFHAVQAAVTALQGEVRQVQPAPGGDLFRNLNTPEDLRAWIESQQPSTDSARLASE